MATQTQQPQDILQQFDALLKHHSIVVSDRENLTKLFECIVDLCTQMPKTKLKAALKTATQESKTKAQPKPKAQPEELVGPIGAGDAPMISDLAEVKSARGRGRPRKEIEPTILPTAVANANPSAETAEKKRRGRPKKDKSVTISSNDDEDALIEKMMADVASMKKDELVSSAPAPASDEETEDEASIESLSPVIHAAASPSSENLEVEVLVPLTKAKAVKAPNAKEPKAKAVKEPKAKAVKEPKAKAVKEPKAKAVKEPKAKEPETKADNESIVAMVSDKKLISENKDINGKLYLLGGFPTSSFTYNGKTYLRTETDNVYDNLTREMIGVWDHANHEIISAFDDVEELWFSDEE